MQPLYISIVSLITTKRKEFEMGNAVRVTAEKNDKGSFTYTIYLNDEIKKTRNAKKAFTIASCVVSNFKGKDIIPFFSLGDKERGKVSGWDIDVNIVIDFI